MPFWRGFSPGEGALGCTAPWRHGGSRGLGAEEWGGDGGVPWDSLSPGNTLKGEEHVITKPKYERI